MADHRWRRVFGVSAPKTRTAEVVDLAKVRANSRLISCRRKVTRALESNRRAVTTLFTAGVLFTKEGSRIGRDLLLAHQHLLRVDALLDRLSGARGATPPVSAARIACIYTELEGLLERTSVLTHRTGDWLEKLRRE